MAARKLDYSNTTPKRECVVRASTQELVDAIGTPLAALSPALLTHPRGKDTIVLSVKDPEPHEIVVTRVGPTHPSFDSFFSDKQPVIYEYPTNTAPHPQGNNPRLRTVDVVVAAGENDLFAALTPVLADRVSMGPLAFGDVAFFLREADCRTRLDVLIERKKNEDFVASKLDGRLEMQTEVMLKNTTRPMRIFHCIEGDLLETRPRQRFNYKAILGSLIYPIMRKNTSVCKVDDVRGTAAFVRNIHALLEHADADKFKNKVMPDPRAMNSTVRKQDITEENQVYAQLANIREVGVVCATAIFKRYPTFPEIFREYLSRGKLALSDTPTDGGGKVGDRVSKRIFDVYRPDLFMPRAKRGKIEDD